MGDAVRFIASWLIRSIGRYANTETNRKSRVITPCHRDRRHESGWNGGVQCKSPAQSLRSTEMNTRMDHQPINCQRRACEKLRLISA